MEQETLNAFPPGLEDHFKNIINSFQTDAIEYIEAFAQKETFSYKQFKANWEFHRNANFLKNLPSQVFEFLYEILGELSGEGSDFYRVGSFYYMFTMYQKGYLGNDSKIPITITHYSKLKLFIIELVNQNKEDVAVLFNSLRIRVAFQINFTKCEVENLSLNELKLLNQELNDFWSELPPDDELDPELDKFSILEKLKLQVRIAETVMGMYPEEEDENESE